MRRGLVHLSLIGILFGAAGAAHAAPRWIRLGWVGPTDTTLAVSWSDDAGGVGRVEYGLPGRTSSNVVVAGVPSGTAELGVLYHARLTGLSPGQSWQVRVESGGALSDWASVRMPPAVGSCGPLRFVAVGDSRGQTVPLAGYVASRQWESIAAAIATEGAHLVLHSGDIVHTGGDAEQWARDVPLYEALTRQVPFFLALGNHDDGPGQGASANYNQLFQTPADGPDGLDDYYSFVAGRVLFAVLSNYTFSFDAQIDWLQGVLERHRSDVDWRVVMFHTPVWSSGPHGNNENDKSRADRLVPLLDAHGVDVVFSGHDHMYERFHPSRGIGASRVVTPLAMDDGRRGVAQGPVYIVTGGGGAVVIPVWLGATEGSAAHSLNLHYVVADVAPGVLTLTVRDCASQTLSPATCNGAIETVVLEKPTASCAQPPDAGVDAGPEDAGIDAGWDASEPDAGVDGGAGVDSGPGRDAGPRDSGVEMPPDAGPSTAPPTSCGCGPSGLAPLPLLVLAWPAVRRKRETSGCGVHRLRGPGAGGVAVRGSSGQACRGYLRQSSRRIAG